MRYKLKATWTDVSAVTTHLLSYGTHKVTIDLSKSANRTFLFLTIQHLNETVVTQGQSPTTLNVYYGKTWSMQSLLNITLHFLPSSLLLCFRLSPKQNLITVDNRLCIENLNNCFCILCANKSETKAN